MSHASTDANQNSPQKQVESRLPGWLKKTLLVVALITSVGANIYFAVQFYSNRQVVGRTISAAQYPLISKRVFVDNPNDILINFVDLRDELREYTEARKERIGIYFEYLPSGVSIGIGDREDYVSASLLKVPLVMAVYNKVADGTISLDTELTMRAEDIDANFGTFWQKGVGSKITVREAIHLVLTESDNTAKNMLLAKISLNNLDDVYNYLDIPPEFDSDGPVVSPKNYSSILRSLYLASYLPVEYSNDMLDIMTKSKHTDRLVAGVPSSVKVAHKIGVYVKNDEVSPEIYTDCGIIYAPLRPYILCVMTESDRDTAIDNISSISKIVYTYVSKQ